MKPENTILFTLVYRNEEYRVYTYAYEYYTLMTLILNYLASDNFGICSGMGSCGTCMVDVYEGNAGTGKAVLSCGIPINDYLANTKIVFTGGEF